MPYNPAIHNRHSIRLPGFDYSQAGAYFLTINSHKKEHLFGSVVAGVVRLTAVGEIAREQWLKIPDPDPDDPDDPYNPNPDDWQRARVNPGGRPKLQIDHFPKDKQATGNTWCYYLAAQLLRRSSGMKRITPGLLGTYGIIHKNARG
jgi:hypothetical protein